jgi:GH24 family phage-related lysozyme (muramidase)
VYKILRFIIVLIPVIALSACINNESPTATVVDLELVNKQESAKDFIKSNEGFLWKAKSDSDGIYRIGYSTPSYQGARTTKMLAEVAFHNYLQTEVFPYIPEGLSFNHYALYADLIFNFGRTGAKQFYKNGRIDCERILTNTGSMCGQYNLSNRRIKEYELCKRG